MTLDQDARRMRVLSITSGKGGVGKTCVSVNIAYWLSKLGARVLLLDADLGLANVDVVLGLRPTHTLEHVLSGEKTLPEIMMEGPGGIRILPAGSGVARLVDLGEEDRLQVFQEFDSLAEPFDYLIVDTGAGISRNVLYFNSAVQDVVVVATPEPTSLTDAYALMKVLSEKGRGYRFRVLANMVADEREAKGVFARLSVVADKFLHVSLGYLGHIVSDPNMPLAVRRQQAVSVLFPKSPAARCMRVLSDRLHNLPPDAFPAGHMQFFWRKLAAQRV
ncbi:MAG: MinD/ParA family protein [Candidatus Tectomicrobia bacterium]|uniref:MinD/ParA family protein n=1 Tax=Tectimicrobiota bacterium TaxID=2528274 RepID=A0A932ZU70_UNCTE|nr:MinD/ParA family protein [Candidatus Tectomicrobia bacterium]MBI4251580.1 MinD/ParA family protein [Candidatus Tectomicrobia bacterium]